jgi:hypothetical protein
MHKLWRPFQEVRHSWVHCRCCAFSFIREISDASSDRAFRWSAVSGTQLPRFEAAWARKPKGSKEIKTLYSLTLLVKDRGTSKP